MFSRLIRAMGATLVVLAALIAAPANANNKTVNGITVETNWSQIQRGLPYSYQIAPSGPSGYVGTYNFSQLSGTLPQGITVSPTGLVTGTTCENNGNYAGIGLRISTNQATPTVADFTAGNAHSVNVTTSPTGSCAVTVAGTPPNGVVGVSYAGAVTASGGVSPYVYALTSGTLPPGVVLNTATGALTGTPTTAGTYTFSIYVTDVGARTGVGTFTVTIAPAATITVAPATLPNGTTTVAYSQTVSASGGTAPYTFALSAGTLPTGLALSASGAITGTPTVAGTYNFTVRGTDNVGNTGTRAYTVAIAGSATLTVNPATLPGGTNGTAYSQNITATGGTAPYTFAVTAGSLPTGLALTSGGVLSGTPTVAGSYTFTVTGTDANGNFGTRSYTVVVAGASTLTVNPATLPGGTNGSAYSQNITATGGTAPYTFAVTAGSLPTGLTLTSGGVLSGTPTAAGSYTFTVTGSDANGNFGSRSYTVVVAGASTLTINPATLPGGTNGSAYSQNITATGGTAPYTFAVTAGSLPTGLTLTSAGVLSGTPTAAGSFTFTVTGSDANGNFGSRSYTVVVAGASTLTINPATLPGGTNGSAYSQNITATGGTAPYSFAVTAGALPNGLTLSSTGVLSGTPTIAGSYTFTVTGTDANGNFGARSYTVAIAGANTLSISPATLPAAANGAAYSQSLSATGGTAPYTYSVSSGALPAGMTVSAAGVVSGTPTVAGTYSFTVSVVDANGNFGTQSYSIVVGGAATLTLAPASLPGGTNGSAYAQTITATGGTAPYTYAVTAGALPAGLVLASNGALSGTPTVAGTSTFTITGTDALGNYGTQAYTVAIAGANTLSVSPTTLPAATNGTSYNETLNATGGTGPYTYAVSSGALPAGMTLSSTGDITGTPTVAGTYTFTVSVVDANGNFGTQAFTVTVAGANALTVTPPTLPNGTNGTAYAQSMAATGGTGPYAYTVSAGALPTGLTLAAGGALSGTPTVAGTSTFTVSVVDANGDFGSQAYTVTIAGANTLSVSPTTLPAATNGTSYNEALNATGGTGPYTYSVSSGALPAGLTLSPTGGITGTPTTAGTYTFTIQVIDANGDFGTQAFTVAVAGAATLSIDPATLPGGTNGTAYSASLVESGGTAPYTFAVTSGALPAGLALDSAGLLSGTPTIAGSYTFTVTGTDANGDFGSRSYTVSIAGADVLAISPATLPAGTNGSAYNETLTASGGTGPYSYSVSSGSLPTGVTLSSTGDLTGTPTVAGTYTFTVSVIDANGDFGSQTYSVTVAGANALTISPSTLPAATNGTPYNQTLTTSGGTAPYTYSVSSGSLPTGVTLSSTGDLTGTPATAGTYTFTVSVIDANGDFGSQTYSVTVAGANALTISPATLPAATNGSAYNETLTTSGGTAPYTYSVSSGSLPTGVTLSSTGDLIGTPTTAGTYTFTVSVIDANGDFGSQTYSVTVAGANALTISPSTLPAGTNGSAYNETLTASGGTAPYSYSVSSGSLPTGVTLSSTGDLTGTPTTAGTYTFTVSVIDANGDFGSQTYSVTVAGANALTIAPATLPGATNGSAYNETLTASGGTAPYSYSVSSGSLPTGVTLSSTGDLTGTPTTAGTYTFTVSVIDANGDFGSQTYSVTVAGANALTISPSTLPAATNGSAYNETLTTSGGTAPYTYSVSSGSLPTGVTLSSTGVLTGTPTVAGTYTFTVSVIDANGDFGSQTYSVTVAGANALTISPATLPAATNGTAYNQTLTTAGGTAPYTYSVSSGSLPTGLALSSTGGITGTPTTAGTYTFTVSVIDANGDFGSQTYSVTVAGANALTISPSTLPSATNGTAYTQTLTTSGGTAPYTYAVSSGSLPTGLVLSSTGDITGTPTTAGTYTLTVSVIDANGDFGSQTYSVTVAGANALTISPSTLPAATNGTAYNQTLTTSGGTAPYTYSVSSGALPTGVSLSSTGDLTGTPTVAGTYTFTVSVIDANGDFGSQTYSVTVAGANTLTVTPPTLPNGTNGTAYAQSMAAIGGTGPYTYVVSSGTLPTGLSLASGGALTGTPTVSGSSTFTVSVTDANGNFGSQAYTVAIAGANTLTVTPPTLPNGTNGTAYAQSMAAVGGTGPYTYVVSSGTLPTGLSLASGGALSGTPSVAGTSTFTVSVTDANGNFGSQAYTVAIAGATNLAITPATLPAGTNGAPYTQAITATGGTPTYAYTITSGALPSGLTLTSAGALSGTPTTSGSYTLTVGVTDANGNSGTQAYTLVVAGAQSLTINPGTLPNGNAGAPYSQAFNAGGVAATYTVASGAVPPGLVLGSNGVLSGTPTAAGTYTFTVRGDDANGNFGTRTVTLLIGDSLRADPTRDPGVSDGIQGQVDAARRAGELQMGHVFRRLASSPTNCTVREGEASNDDACDDRIQVWATGTREQHYNRDGSSYLGAFTVGGDVAVGTGRFGVALGSGWDAATRASGVRGDVDSRAMMVYGRIPVQDAIAIDVVAGKSSLDLDNRRTTTGGTALGNRDGDTTFGGIGIAADWTIGAATLAPYARYEFASTQLDGYAEAGPNAVALSYSQLRTRTTSFVFGTELGYGLHFDWGTLTPRLRIEMRQRNGDDVSQAMAYVDRPATQYLLVRPGVDDRAVLAAFGVEAAFHGVTLQLEYGTAGSALDNFEGQTLRFGLRAGF